MKSSERSARNLGFLSTIYFGLEWAAYNLGYFKCLFNLIKSSERVTHNLRFFSSVQLTLLSPFWPFGCS